MRSHSLTLAFLVALASPPLGASPTTVEFRGVAIGSKLRTSPVEFRMKVGLPGGGFLPPGAYDVEVASTGDRSRVLLVFSQKGRKAGEAPGVLKPGSAAPRGIDPCIKPGSINPCVKPAGVEPCVKNRGAIDPCWKPGATGAPSSSGRYLSFEQLGFAGGARATLRAGVGGGTLLTIPGAGGATIETELPAAH